MWFQKLAPQGQMHGHVLNTMQSTSGVCLAASGLQGHCQAPPARWLSRRPCTSLSGRTVLSRYGVAASACPHPMAVSQSKNGNKSSSISFAKWVSRKALGGPVPAIGTVFTIIPTSRSYERCPTDLYGTKRTPQGGRSRHASGWSRYTTSTRTQEHRHRRTVHRQRKSTLQKEKEHP